LDGLVDLEHLDFTTNSGITLFTLPPGIFKDNANLRTLYLKNNKFNNKTFVDGSVTSYFQGMEFDFKGWEINANSLRNLWIENCDIRTLEGLLDGLVALEKLDLSFNPFTSLESSHFKDLKMLRELDVGENNVEACTEKPFLGLEAIEHILCDYLPDSCFLGPMLAEQYKQDFEDLLYNTPIEFTMEFLEFMQGGDSSRTEWVEFREKYHVHYLWCKERVAEEVFDEVY